MKIVWVRGDVTVRDVYEEILRRRKIAYTTVLTMMKILEHKGFLKRRGGEKAYVYRAVHAKKKVLGSMVRDFIDRVFNGAAEPLLVHLVENRKLSGRDLEEIARALRRKP